MAVDPEVQESLDLVMPANADGTRPEPAEPVGPGESIGETAAEESAPASAPAPDYAERFTRLERSNAELTDLIARMSERRAATEPAADRPPVERVETLEDLTKLLDWREQRSANRLLEMTTANATAVASEQRARGIFNTEQMGPGRDYDALIQKHIAPIERNDPSFARIFAGQRDPATAKYAMAAVLEIVDRAGGDPVKGLANLWAALDGKQATTDQVVSRIKKAAERQVGRTALRSSRGSDTPKGLNADEVRDLSVSDFAKKFPHLVA